jgi:hypothetical protein
MLPLGPHSSILTTISPTIHKMKRIKEPMMTIPGSSCRWEISQSMMIMKRRANAAAVIQKGKYLRGGGRDVSELLSKRRMYV